MHFEVMFYNGFYHHIFMFMTSFYVTSSIETLLFLCSFWQFLKLWLDSLEEASLEKTLMLGKCEGKRRRGRQRTRWLDSVNEATNMNRTQLREAVEDRRAWHALVHGVTKSRTRLND